MTNVSINFSPFTVAFFDIIGVMLSIFEFKQLEEDTKLQYSH